LAAYSSDNGSCDGNLTEIGCDDDNGDGFMSLMNLSGLTPGDVIFVLVDGYNGASGTFGLSVSYGTALANDDAAGAIAITMDNYWGVPGWDTFDIAGATESLPACDGGDAGDDSWYSFVAQSENQGILARPNPTNADAANVDMVIQVFDATGTPLAGTTADGCGVDRSCYNNYAAGEIERAVPTGLTIGDTYLYRVYDANANPFNCSESLLIDTKVKTYVPHEIVDGCVNEVINVDHTWTVDNPVGMYNVPPVPVIEVRMAIKDASGNIVSLTPSSQFPYSNADLEFSLADFSPALSNGDYEVCAQHLVKMQSNGCIEAYWSQAGPSCPTTVNLFGDVVTSLTADDCGITGLDMESVINATPVLGASMYQFNFTNASFPANSFSFESANGSLLLGSASVFDAGVLQGLYFGQTYNVTVQAYMGGSYNLEGPVCTITMSPTPPTPEIINGCGTDRLTSIKNTGVGMSYQWGFYSTGNAPNSAPDYIVTTSNPQLNISPQVISTLPFAAGETVTIYVRAFDQYVDPIIPTVANFSDWSITGCDYTLPTAGEASPSDGNSNYNNLSFTAYPNPNEGEQVFVKLNDVIDNNQKVVIDIFDMYGKKVHSEQFANAGSEINKVITFDQKLSSGLYMINLSVNETIITQKLIIE